MKGDGFAIGGKKSPKLGFFLYPKKTGVKIILCLDIYIERDGSQVLEKGFLAIKLINISFLIDNTFQREEKVLLLPFGQCFPIHPSYPCSI